MAYEAGEITQDEAKAACAFVRGIDFDTTKFLIERDRLIQLGISYVDLVKERNHG